MRSIRAQMIAVLAFLFVITWCRAQTNSTLITFEIPGAGTQVNQGVIPNGIAQDGAIVGVFIDENNVSHGFLRTRLGVIIPIDVPEAGSAPNQGTSAWAINTAGIITGGYVDGSDVRHGFIRSRNGIISTLDVPGAYFTQPGNINSSGTIAGSYRTLPNVRHGFIRNSDGVFTLFDFPSDWINPGFILFYGLNDSGNVIGNFRDAQQGFHGWLRTPDGTLTQIDVPGSTYTFLLAINSQGSIGGYYGDENYAEHGFIREPSGRFITFDAPGALDTQVISMSTSGATAGTFWDQYWMAHGFLRDINGNFTTIDVPAAVQGTYVNGNNSYGSVTGDYVDETGAFHGFVQLPILRGAKNCVESPFGLVGWWRGNGNFEDSASNMTTTMIGNIQFTQAMVQKGFVLDGVNDYIHVGDEPPIHTIDTGVTITAWINPQPPVEPGGGFAHGWILSGRDPLITEGYGLHLNNAGYLAAVLRADQILDLAAWPPSTTLFDGTWKHVALTADTITGEVSFYVNGQRISALYPGLTGHFAEVHNLFIGHRQPGDAGEGQYAAGAFNGLMDEVQLFNRALSDSEIKTIYQAGARGLCNQP